MNNKIYLIATLIAVLLFSRCEDVYDHVAADPQSYEQEEEQTINGFTFTLGTGLASPIVLNNEHLDNETILAAINTTATPTLSEDAYVDFKIEVSDTEDFENFIELNSYREGNNASILATDLNEAVKELYGRRPEARNIYLRGTYQIVDGSTSSMMPNPVILGPVAVTPVAPVIESEYYLIGDLNGWSFDNLEDYKFKHSGLDVYEDPYFTILVNYTNDDNIFGNFKIVPLSSKEADSWDDVIGNPIDQNIALEGELIGGNPGSMKVELPGWVRITLNMMEYTYEIELIGDMNLSLYVPGGHQGWNPETAPTLYSRNLDFKYNGFVYFPDDNTGYKFTEGPNWDKGYGDGGDGTLSESGPDLMMEESGYYKLDVDFSGSPYTYIATKTVWGIVGDATPGGWDADTEMTYNPETRIWTINTALNSGDFKFRANNDWDINLGGNIGNLSYGGDNITVQEGTYTITLDLSDSEQFRGTIVKN